MIPAKNCSVRRSHRKDDRRRRVGEHAAGLVDRRFLLHLEQRTQRHRPPELRPHDLRALRRLPSSFLTASVITAPSDSSISPVIEKARSSVQVEVVTSAPALPRVASHACEQLDDRRDLQLLGVVRHHRADAARRLRRVVDPETGYSRARNAAGMMPRGRRVAAAPPFSPPPLL